MPPPGKSHVEQFYHLLDNFTKPERLETDATLAMPLLTFTPVLMSYFLNAINVIVLCILVIIKNAIYHANTRFTLSLCAAESCPTPGDNRGSTSPFGSLSFPFRVPLSQHVQIILKLLVQPWIPEEEHVSNRTKKQVHNTRRTRRHGQSK